MHKRPFATGIEALRERARRHIEQGAVIEGYQADHRRGDVWIRARQFSYVVINISACDANDCVPLSSRTTQLCVSDCNRAFRR